eukprot:2410941-Prymnesium_polylepis.1
MEDGLSPNEASMEDSLSPNEASMEDGLSPNEASIEDSSSPDTQWTRSGINATHSAESASTQQIRLNSASGRLARTTQSKWSKRSKRSHSSPTVSNCGGPPWPR